MRGTAGMGERAPTATCPSPSSMPAMAVIMVSTGETISAFGALLAALIHPP